MNRIPEENRWLCVIVARISERNQVGLPSEIVSIAFESNSRLRRIDAKAGTNHMQGIIETEGNRGMCFCIMQTEFNHNA
jgi:hypothetical protein